MDEKMDGERGFDGRLLFCIAKNNQNYKKKKKRGKSGLDGKILNLYSIIKNKKILCLFCLFS